MIAGTKKEIDRNHLAEMISKVWNFLSKENGWPNKQNSFDVLRKNRILTKVISGMETASKAKSYPNNEAAIKWILSRWNWKKSPAPLGLLESKDQWQALTMVLQRIDEENDTAIEENSTKIKDWIDSEYRIRIMSGKPSSTSKKEVEEYAIALGKFQALTKEEKLLFLEHLETIN
jgi:hypothetical protein